MTTMPKHLLVIVALALAGGAIAEDLPDPTRPPAGYASGETVSVGPVLQSVLISPTRRIAIISGKTVKVGDKYEGTRVASISDNEVVLKNGKTSQVLRLYPVLHPAGQDGRPGSKLDGQVKQR